LPPPGHPRSVDPRGCLLARPKDRTRGEAGASASPLNQRGFP